jgi:hypothetical protein
MSDETESVVSLYVDVWHVLKIPEFISSDWLICVKFDDVSNVILKGLNVSMVPWPGLIDDVINV